MKLYIGIFVVIITFIFANESLMYDSSNSFNETNSSPSQIISGNGNSHINTGSGNLLYTQNLFTSPGKNNMAMSLDLVYNGSAQHTSTSGIYPNGAGTVRYNLPEWILSVNGIAIQVLNFERNVHNYKNDGDISNGTFISRLIPGYHYTSGGVALSNLDGYEEIKLLKGDGSHYTIYINEFNDAFTGSVNDKFKFQISGSIGYPRTLSILPGDGTKIIYEEEVLGDGNYNRYIDDDCASDELQLKIFYPTQIIDQYGNWINFTYTDDISSEYSQGRKKLSQIDTSWGELILCELNLEYGLQSNHGAPYIQRDEGTVYKFSYVDSNEYIAAFEHYLINKIELFDGPNLINTTEFDYCDQSLNMRTLDNLVTDYNLGYWDECSDYSDQQYAPSTIEYPYMGITEIKYPTGLIETFSYLEYNDDSRLDCEDCSPFVVFYDQNNVPFRLDLKEAPIIKSPNFDQFGRDPVFQKMVTNKTTFTSLDNYNNNIYLRKESISYTNDYNPNAEFGNYDFPSHQSNGNVYIHHNNYAQDFVNYTTVGTSTIENSIEVQKKREEYTFNLFLLKQHDREEIIPYLVEYNLFDTDDNDPIQTQTLEYDHKTNHGEIDPLYEGSTYYTGTNLISARQSILDQVATTFEYSYIREDVESYFTDVIEIISFEPNGKRISKIYNNEFLFPSQSNPEDLPNTLQNLYLSNLIHSVVVDRGDQSEITYYEITDYYDDGISIGEKSNYQVYTDVSGTKESPNLSGSLEWNYFYYTDVLDGIGNLYQVITPSGGITEFEYNTSPTQIKKLYIDDNQIQETVVFDEAVDRKRFATKKLTYINQSDFISEYYDYDLSGNMVLNCDDNLFVTEFEYDQFNRLKTKTNPGDFSTDPVLSYSEKYLYDDSFTDGDNLSTKIISRQDSDDASIDVETTFSYNALGTIENESFAGTDMARNFSFEYDYNGQVTTGLDIDYYTQYYSYDIFGRKTSIKYPTEDYFNETSDVEAIENISYLKLSEIGTDYSYPWTHTGNVTQVLHTDEVGNTYEKVLDEYGKTICEKRSIDTGLYSYTYYNYDNNANLINVKNAEDQLISLSYDDANRLIQITHPDRGIKKIVNNAIGKPSFTQTSVQAQLNSNLFYEWTYYKYDLAGRLVEKGVVWVPNLEDIPEYPGNQYTGEIKQKLYYDQYSCQNSIGRLSFAYEVSANILTKYDYDENGNVSKQSTFFDPNIIVDPQTQQVTSIDYDTRSDLYELHFYYNSVGHMEKIVYPNGLDVNYTYNQLGLVSDVPGYIESTELDGITYNRNLLVKSLGYMNGQNEWFSYNSRGWLKQEIGPAIWDGEESNLNRTRKNYDYFKNGNLAETSKIYHLIQNQIIPTVLPINQNDTQETIYNYLTEDNDHSWTMTELQSILADIPVSFDIHSTVSTLANNQNSGRSKTDLRSLLSTDNLSNNVSIELICECDVNDYQGHFKEYVSNGNIFILGEKFLIDRFDLLEKTQSQVISILTNNQTHQITKNYLYNQLGIQDDIPPIHSVQDSVLNYISEVIRFQTQIDVELQWEEYSDGLFTYNGMSMLKSADYSRYFGPENSISYEYDKLGNRTGYIFGGELTEYNYDVTVNNQLSGTIQNPSIYQYDALGNLIEDDMSSQSYRYDFINRLVEVNTSDDTYTYDYDFFGNRVRKTNSIGDEKRFIYSGNRIIAEYDNSFDLVYNYIYLGQGMIARVTSESEKEFIHRDRNGSPNCITDDTGDILWKRDYYPFGKIRSTSGNPDYNSITYEAKFFDNETNLWYNTARYFNDLGRFTQTDPSWYKYKHLSPYVRVGNNPFNYNDSNGKSWDWPRKLLSFAMDMKMMSDNVDEIDEWIDDELDVEFSDMEIAMGLQHKHLVKTQMNGMSKHYDNWGKTMHDTVVGEIKGVAKGAAKEILDNEVVDTVDELWEWAKFVKKVKDFFEHFIGGQRRDGANGAGGSAGEGNSGAFSGGGGGIGTDEGLIVIPIITVDMDKMRFIGFGPDRIETGG